MATCGIAAGAQEVFDVITEEIKKRGIKNLLVVPTGCVGMCYAEPLLEIKKPGETSIFVSGITAKACGKLIEDVFEKAVKPEEITSEASIFRHPGYGKQVRIALRNCGRIDPSKIDDYIATGGYAALGKVLSQIGREGVIEEIKKSGLRGRGGAGFPTGLKWEFGASAKGDNAATPAKYIICNADEGDPGAFMDRSILEGDPHSVLEAMAIAGYAIGAGEGIIYIRAEYPLAVQRLYTAIAQAEELGLLGENIMGTGFSFNLKINLGAGAFVCGEETALLNSLEGKRGEPRLRPPFPAQKGLWQQPTVNNNVETYVCIPAIITAGADWFREIGTEKSPGTKVFSLAGKINNVGLIEVPIGTTLREIIYEIGGGLPGGKKFKAVQTGGPSGGCISQKHLDIGVDFETLGAIGSMMGSGGMIVMDEDDCMVNIARFYLDFTVEESCGKCTPCRIGTTRLHEILDRITTGAGEESDIEKLRELGRTIKDTALCGLGMTAPNPVLSTLQYFPEEYLAHVKEKKCPACACKNLIEYEIMPKKCIGCTLCAKVCPVDCIFTTETIQGKNKKLHEIDKSRCIKCGECLQKCPTKAIFVQ
ncbi:MAG: NADH-quinone oxidoreductase subunit NuoF [Defluviitaleaceae bacterium]|nr:NADH-quinone oxidoreductase subunit NuoF [Defluviitaleaceae bacterium]